MSWGARLALMKIAIIGATGTLGCRVAGELRLRSHNVRVLSRHTPQHRIELATGEALSPRGAARPRAPDGWGPVLQVGYSHGHPHRDRYIAELRADTSIGARSPSRPRRSSRR